jgi:hypothetical protein
MKTPLISQSFVVDEALYNLACDLGIDTSANVEDEFPLPVYKVVCTQQEYIILKNMLKEGE